MKDSLDNIVIQTMKLSKLTDLEGTCSIYFKLINQYILQLGLRT